MAAGDVKIEYAASSALTVTNLHSIASSPTYIAGWMSAAVDNTTNKYQDYLLSGIIKAIDTPASTVGQIRIYVVGILEDSTWPAQFTGSEGTVTLTAPATNIRDSVCRLAAVITNATTISIQYPFGPVSVAARFGGVLPKKFVVFVTHSMVQNLDDTNNAIYITPIYHTVAQ